MFVNPGMMTKRQAMICLALGLAVSTVRASKECASNVIIFDEETGMLNTMDLVGNPELRTISIEGGCCEGDYNFQENEGVYRKIKKNKKAGDYRGTRPFAIQIRGSRVKFTLNVTPPPNSRSYTCTDSALTITKDSTGANIVKGSWTEGDLIGSAGSEFTVYSSASPPALKKLPTLTSAMRNDGKKVRVISPMADAPSNGSELSSAMAEITVDLPQQGSGNQRKDRLRQLGSPLRRRVEMQQSYLNSATQRKAGLLDANGADGIDPANDADRIDPANDADRIDPANGADNANKVTMG